MVDVNHEIINEIDSLRGDLHNLLVSENSSNESILRVSQELDKIIVRYIKQKK